MKTTGIILAGLVALKFMQCLDYMHTLHNTEEKRGVIVANYCCERYELASLMPASDITIKRGK